MKKLMNALLENIFINSYEKEKQLGVMVIEFLSWSSSSPLFFSLLMFVYVQLIMQNVHAFCRIANPQKEKKKVSSFLWKRQPKISTSWNK